jgi:hypothetical protein
MGLSDCCIMLRARVLALAVWLLSYGAVGARQPAVRSSVPLPAPAAEIAALLELPSADRSRMMLDIVRLLFDAPDGQDVDDARLRARLSALMAERPSGESAPLPLDPSIWRETLLQRQVPDDELLAAVLSERRTALLYYGLAGLDDETLGVLGPDRALLTKLAEHAAIFAAFGQSLRVKGGRVVVPGGSEMERVWEEMIGAPVSDPPNFARRLFTRSQGRLAFFYDTVAHLDPPRQRFALANGRLDRMRALAQTFDRATVDLRPAERPFSRLYVDPFLTIAAIDVTANGTAVGPAARGLWDVVFEDSERLDYQFRPATVGPTIDTTPVDAAWLLSRIHRHSVALAQRRRDAYLFGQRVFDNPQPRESSDIATALRGMISFPALLLTLERAGVRSPATMAAAAVRAHAINQMGDSSARRTALTGVQAGLGLLERMVLSGGLTPAAAARPIDELLAIDFSDRAAPRRFAAWVAAHLAGQPDSNGDVPSAEARVLARMAGVALTPEAPVTVDWEGRTYRVNPADAELLRLRQVRERQRGPSLDDALAAAQAASGGPSGRARGDDDPNFALGQVLASLLYAAHLGEPDGTALAAGNVALRHDLGLSGQREGPLVAWRIAWESFGGRTGWRLIGSLLGLDVPLARFALRRLDASAIPQPPTLTANEKHIASLTSALLRPNVMTDAARDEIAGALARGRARAAALSGARGEIELVAREAGLSGWRREALAWTLTHDPARAADHFSPLELFWLGRSPQTELSQFDPWGAAAYPFSGCLCLVMPRPVPWESFGGRPALGVLAGRGADVTIVVAEALSHMRLPAALAPGVAAFALQEVLDSTLPAYFDDWSQFGRAARELTQEQIVDYVAALTADGPLLPVSAGTGQIR